MTLWLYATDYEVLLSAFTIGILLGFLIGFLLGLVKER